MTGTITCEQCGSPRVLAGPFYDKGQMICLECGWHSEQTEPEQYAPIEIDLTMGETEEREESNMAAVIEEFPSSGFKTPEEAEKYLAKLQKEAEALRKGQTATKTKSKKAKPPAVPTPAVDDIEADLIWLSIHVYMRRNSTWNQTLHDAREEKKLRNDNVRVFAHEHNYGAECTEKCREQKD